MAAPMPDPNIRFRLFEIQGNLFTATCSLAHCIASDANMGAGIAVEFQRQFGHRQLIRDMQVPPGGLAAVPDGPRYIYNLVTKAASWNKPTYRSLHLSLLEMRQHMIANHVITVAIPRIGCGLDGLEWSHVRRLIHDIFRDDQITIWVFYLQ